MLDPLEFCDSLINEGIKQNFIAIQFDEISGYPLIALRRESSSSAKHIYISAAIHGDEPASALSIQQMLLQKRLPETANVTICPLLNPTGLIANTRENEKGIDLNRDFKNPKSREITSLTKYIDSIPKIDLSICLHEDWESKGFYLYYINAESKQLAEKTVDRISSFAPIELSQTIDGRPADKGIIHPPQTFNPDILEGWPEAFYLYSKNAHQHFTLETPSSLPMQVRIEMNIAAIDEILTEIC